jgi:hypothetical protein
MIARVVAVAAVAAVLLVLGATQAAAKDQPDGCQNDSKLIGPIALSTADTPGTWWHMTKEGLIASGVPETEFKSTMEGWFGMSFASLDEAVQFLVGAVASVDRNGDGVVCASALRGTRAHFGDPNITLVSFNVTDNRRTS